jgi:hypothetical protein
MLAAASERFPRGGALLMGLMGTAGTLSIYYVLPLMGHIFDSAKIQASGGEDAFKNLTGDRLNQVLGVAAQTSFRYVAILPAILLVVLALFDLRQSQGRLQTREAGRPHCRRRIALSVGVLGPGKTCNTRALSPTYSIIADPHSTFGKEVLQGDRFDLGTSMAGTLCCFST